MAVWLVGTGTGAGWRRAGLSILAALALLLPAPAHATIGTGYAGQSADPLGYRAIDLVWGDGRKGPYSLSRRPVIPGSASVRLNGARELLPTDYRIDSLAGSITFTAALTREEIARVEYSYSPAGADLKPGSPNGPVSLDLAQVQVGSRLSSTFRLNGAWRTAEQGSAEVTAIGMGMDTRLGAHTKISSLVAVTPSTARPAGQTGDGIGVQLAAQTETQRGAARVGYLRTGEAFGAASDYKWQRDVERLDVAGSYALTRRLDARSSFVRTEENRSGSKPTRTTAVLTNALTAAITPLSKLTFQRREEQVTTADMPEQTKVCNQVQLDQKLGQAGAAQVRHEVVVAGDGTAEETTTTTAMKLDAQVMQGTHITAERVEVHSVEQDPAVQTQLAVTAGTPGASVKLQGEYSARERPGQADEEVQGARIEAKPLDILKIGGGVRQTQTGDDTRLLTHADVEVKAPAGIRVAGSLQEQTDGAGNTVGRVQAVDASFKPIQGLEMSGTYKKREEQDQDGPLTQGLRVSIAPWKLLQLNGGVIRNPEEKGQVLQEERRTLGVRSDLGFVKLSGDVARRLDLSRRPLADEMKVGLTLQITRFDRIITSYKLAEESGASGLTTTQYTFGYARRIAGALDLSLEGEYLQRAQGSLTLNDQREARARASLNARF